MCIYFLKKISAVVVGATAIAVGTAAAPSQATTLTGFATYGDMMAGMNVTVNFLDGGSETAIWAATSDPTNLYDANSGGAFGNNWSLTQAGNTFGSPWTFSNLGKSIASLAINAIPGNTVFNTDLYDDNGYLIFTPDSGGGWTFQALSGVNAPSSFTYSVPIDISIGDLFGNLSLKWNSGFNGQMQFIADTDSGSAIDPVAPQSVPEPTYTLSLLSLGVLGVISRRQRKPQHKA